MGDFRLMEAIGKRDDGAVLIKVGEKKGFVYLKDENARTPLMDLISLVRDGAGWENIRGTGEYKKKDLEDMLEAVQMD